jgi:hypothetical protein
MKPGMNVMPLLILAVDNTNMAMVFISSGRSDKLNVVRWEASVPQTTAETVQKQRQII